MVKSSGCGEVHHPRRSGRSKQNRLAPVSITLTLTSIPGPDDTVAIDATVAPRNPEVAGSLYLIVTEDALVLHVLGGEDGGATLSHDNAARPWLDPVPS